MRGWGAWRDIVRETYGDREDQSQRILHPFTSSRQAVLILIGVCDCCPRSSTNCPVTAMTFIDFTLPPT